MYAHYINGHFTFPPNFDFNILPGKDSPSTVISVIGESDLISCINKMEVFENFTKTSMKPMNLGVNFGSSSDGETGNSYLCGYFCEMYKIVFIHLRSLNDTELLIHKMKTMKNDKLKENHFDWEDSMYTKLILYLFLLSDFVIINVVGLNFDPYYVQLLTQANILRKKMKSITENELKTISTSPEVTNNGRLFQPCLLFIFNPTNTLLYKELSKKTKSLEALRDKLEERLYGYLMYHNVIGTEYSMARIQTHCPFVLVRDPNRPLSVVDLLGLHCLGLPRPPDYVEKLNTAAAATEEFLTEQVRVLHIHKESIACMSENVHSRSWFKACHKMYNLFISDKLRLFTEVLSEHRMAFFEKGCQLALSLAESQYKDGLPTQYSRDVHSEKTKSARKLLLRLARGPGLLPSVTRLETQLHKVWAVGRQLCEAVSVTGQRCKHELHRLPRDDGDSAYSRDNDDNSGSDVSALARDGLDQPECTDYSLRESQIVEPVAKPQQTKLLTRLPVMRHSSEVQIVAACNCGRRQAARRDPFDYREANYVFYEQMNEMCCFRFNRANLPENARTVRVPSSHSDVVDKTVLSRQHDSGGDDDEEAEDDAACSIEDEEEDEEVRFDEDEEEDDGGPEDESYEDDEEEEEEDDIDVVKVRKRREDDEDEEEDDDDDDEEDEDGAKTDEEEDDDDDNNVSMRPRQRHHQEVSTSSNSAGCYLGEEEPSAKTKKKKTLQKTKKMPNKFRKGVLSVTTTVVIEKSLFAGMITDQDPRTMGPYYPSWSLIDSGPYFSYTHSTGLEYPGFVHGSNFLLPWDISLKTKINKVRKQRVKRAFAAGNFLKAFLGFEMECPVGHRFFLAGPERMMRGSMPSAQVKEAVRGLLTRDVPLYQRCQCGDYLGQLARIYVAVPPNSGLLRMLLQPRVRPPHSGAELPPLFTPGVPAVELTAGRLWVLRLPLAYERMGHLYRHDASQPANHADEGKLLSHSVFYEEIHGCGGDSD